MSLFDLRLGSEVDVDNIDPPIDLYKTMLGSEGDIEDSSSSNHRIGAVDVFGNDEPPPASYELLLESDGDIKDGLVDNNHCGAEDVNLKLTTIINFHLKNDGDQNKATIVVQEFIFVLMNFYLFVWNDGGNVSVVILFELC